MIRRRKSEGFNLAFLDIMACGLGAIILVFMLVKQNIEKSTLELDLLSSDLDRLQQKEAAIKEEIKKTQEMSSAEEEKVKKIESEIIQIQKEIKKNIANISENKARIDSLQKKIEKTPPAKKSDVIQQKNIGEEEYIMGLKVEGRKIAILIDSSSSMTDEKLINIIRRKSGSDSGKKKGPKWVRAKRIVSWLMARIPEGSQVYVASFNDKVRTLGGKGWINGRDPAAISRVLSDLESIVPRGATNLQKGLEDVSRNKPTNLYLVTDGLPTVGDANYKSLNPFSSCSSLLGSSKTISGECRVKLFRQTVTESAPRGGAIVNVVLLPVEGDPDASAEYWRWSSLSGGLLISPAVNWP